MYEYHANITKVIDGDTVHALIDLGFGITKCEVLRLYGINTCELNSKDSGERALAEKARDRLTQLIGDVDHVRTFKDKREKYGRMLAVLYTRDGISLNDVLVNEGLAKAYYG